jgi:hypothetical protein
MAKLRGARASCCTHFSFTTSHEIASPPLSLSRLRSPTLAAWKERRKGLGVEESLVHG